MALICKRLLGQGQLTGCFYRGLYTSQVQCVTMKTADKKPGVLESYDERNARFRRPQSPHLTIYRPQLTTLLSVSHRATGMVLSAYTVTLGLGTLVLPESFPHYMAIVEDLHLPPLLFCAAKFCIAFPLCYHYCNGIRHLLWDMGKNLSMKQVYVTGYIMFLTAVASTAVVSCL